MSGIRRSSKGTFWTYEPWRLTEQAGASLYLPGHTSEPIAFDGQAITASLAEVRQRIDLL